MLRGGVEPAAVPVAAAAHSALCQAVLQVQCSYSRSNHRIVYESDVTHPRKLLPNNQPRPNQMSSTLVNYASRVLSVDQESNSFVPIVGLNKTPDMPIFEAVMFAWRGCAILRASVDEDDMEVPTTVVCAVSTARL